MKTRTMTDGCSTILRANIFIVWSILSPDSSLLRQNFHTDNLLDFSYHHLSEKNAKKLQTVHNYSWYSSYFPWLWQEQ